MSESCLQETLLNLVSKRGKINTLDLANELNVEHQKIVGAMMSIQTYPDIIICETHQSKKYNLSKEGFEICANGSLEFNVYKNVPNEGIELSKLISKFAKASDGKLGFSKAMQNNWILLDKSEEKPLIKRKTDMVNDEIPIILEKIKQLKFDEVDDKTKQDLKKRKLIEESTQKSFNITKGPSFVVTLEKQETDIDSEMILKGTWKTKQFKDYNFDAMGISPNEGHLHPLLKVRDEYIKIFLEMGFCEMPANQYVEVSFWNFDVLFQPQDHPARDAHDTFYLKTPNVCSEINSSKKHIEAVEKVHSKGEYGSDGYDCFWDINKAKKNLLRTHTTAISAKCLYLAAQEYLKNKGSFKPLKYFSIDKVFRNETLDATHLAEFYQLEGLIANVGLSLGDLMGFLRKFFQRLGIKNLKFKPAYNPYTEPSMEIFSYHDGLKKWVEVGNSGIFRPEMLRPMGFPDEVRVIAFGLSLERPTMIKYGINNIRDLCGHKIDLQMVHNNPICILEDFK